MKTIRKGTAALSGEKIRLIVDRDAYAVIIGAESYGYGFDRARAEQAFDSIAARSRYARVVSDRATFVEGSDGAP